MATAAIQMLLDGGVEDVDAATGMSFAQFMRTSSEEGGLLSGSQAAVILGCTPARVQQLMDGGKLTSWEFLGKRYVSGREVDARRKAELSKGGRPRKAGEQLKVAAKVLAGNDWRQAASAAFD